MKLVIFREENVACGEIPMESYYLFDYSGQGDEEEILSKLRQDINDFIYDIKDKEEYEELFCLGWHNVVDKAIERFLYTKEYLDVDLRKIDTAYVEKVY